MKSLKKVDCDLPIPIPTGTPMPMEITVAMEALQRALDAGVEIAKQHEDAKTERALILANREIQIAKIEAETMRGCANDRNIHEQRMKIIEHIGALLINNAQHLTPEILNAAQLLVMILREEK